MMDIAWKLFLLLNSNSWDCLQESGLKLIVHCAAHSETFERSWFRLTVVVVITCTIDNKKVSSVKRFWLECKTFSKLLMYIKTWNFNTNRNNM